MTTHWTPYHTSSIAPESGATAGMSPKRGILLTLIMAVLATAAIAIVALITGEFGEAAAKSVISLWSVIWFALLALAGTWRTEIVPRPRLESFTIACALFGIVTSLVTIWVSHSGLIARAYTVAWVLAFATAHASLLLGTRRPDDAGAVRAMMTATLVLIAIAASLISLLLLAGISGGVIVTIILIVLVLDVTANVLVFLLRKFLAPIPVQGAAASQRVPRPMIDSGR
jgi:hypothetical protein